MIEKLQDFIFEVQQIFYHFICHIEMDVRLLFNKKLQSKISRYNLRRDNYIPNSSYCYDNSGTCPYWDFSRIAPGQMNGYCHYLQTGDFDYFASTLILWDQCKCCGVNDEFEYE